MNNYLKLKKDIKSLHTFISSIDKRLEMLNDMLEKNNVFFGTYDIQASRMDFSKNTTVCKSPIESKLEHNVTKLESEIKELQVSRSVHEVELVLKNNDLELYEYKVVNKLSKEDKRLLKLLEDTEDIDKISKEINITRSTVYRNLKRIKDCFKKIFNFNSYLITSKT